MSAATFDFALAIGGAAGQGIATPGNIVARMAIRRGLHLNMYNAYQSSIRGGHIFLTMRISDEPVYNHGDRLDLLLCLNQDTLNRHLRLMGPGTRVVFNSDSVDPAAASDGSGDALFCPLPVNELTDQSKNKLVQNTVALGAIVSLLGVDFKVLEDAGMPQKWLDYFQSLIEKRKG